MLESELRIKLLDSFEELTFCLEELCNSILSETALIAWLQEINHYPFLGYVKTHRENACSVLRQLEYFDEQQPREIIVAAGFIGASEQTLALAQALNTSKSNFKSKMLELKTSSLSLKEPKISKGIQSILSKRPQSTSHTLSQIGLSRLHLKQCYRKIPILDHTPSKISWTWAHTRSIKKVTASQAKELLLKKGMGTHIELQIKKCEMLAGNEPLAIIQELAPHLRANIVFKENNQIKRMMIKGPLPIFFPATEQTPYPDFKPPKEKQDKDKSRVIRSDVRIDPEVYLPAIRAHRYLK